MLRRSVEVALFAPLGAFVTAVAATRRRWGAVAPAEPAAAPDLLQFEPESPAGRDPSADDHLPVEGYDHLAASQVVDRLGALTPPELAVIAAYERSHRHRQTVLTRIAQLQA